MNPYDGPLRTADDKRAAFQDGRYFSLDQGELHKPPGYDDWPGRLPHAIDFCIGLLQLNNGKWLARPTTEANEYAVWATQYASREQALRTAVAEVLRLARRRSREESRQLYSGRISAEQAQAIIAWAEGLLQRPVPALFVAPPPPPPLYRDGDNGQRSMVL
jgi:hypothetical protein